MNEVIKRSVDEIAEHNQVNQWMIFGLILLIATQIIIEKKMYLMPFQ